LSLRDEEERRKHIRFGIYGTISGVTPQGKTTIRVCRLDNDGLRSERQSAQEKIHTRYHLAFADPQQEVNDETVATRIRSFLNGTEAHSAAALDYIRLFEKKRTGILPKVLRAGAGQP
jgi:hypothetical protein